MIGIADQLTCEELLAVLEAVQRLKPTTEQEVVAAQTELWWARSKRLASAHETGVRIVHLNQTELEVLAHKAIASHRTREANKARHKVAEIDRQNQERLDEAEQ